MKVLMPMTADLFHYGHYDAINKASVYGEIVVGLLSDADIETCKQKRPIMTFSERRRSVLCHPLVTAVLQIPIIITGEFHLTHKIDLIVHGDDFNEDKISYHYPYAQQNQLYRSIPYEETISTTEILRRIRKPL
jgi:cytidyltransferase-like protein